MSEDVIQEDSDENASQTESKDDTEKKLEMFKDNQKTPEPVKIKPVDPFPMPSEALNLASHIKFLVTKAEQDNSGTKMQRILKQVLLQKLMGKVTNLQFGKNSDNESAFSSKPLSMKRRNTLLLRSGS